MAASARHTFKYYPHLYVLPDGRVLHAAQDDKPVATKVLDLASQSWSMVDARLLEGHSSAMYLPGKVIKCGKATADSEGSPAVATTYVLDMTAPSPAWQATAPMAFPRSYHNLTILPDGQVLVTGGGRTTDKANYGTAVLEAELWNPSTKTWTTMSRAQRPRLYHSTALLLPDATVLVAGGGRRTVARNRTRSTSRTSNSSRRPTCSAALARRSRARRPRSRTGRPSRWRPPTRRESPRSRSSPLGR